MVTWTETGPPSAGLGAWFGVCSAPMREGACFGAGGGGVAGIAWETGVLTS